MRLLLILLLAFPLLVFADSPVGAWVVPGADAVLAIEHHDAQLAIRIISTLDPEAQDANTDKPLSGTIIGTGFDADSKGWRSGKLYDPVTGKTYRARLRLLDTNHLEVRGYIATPLLGRSEIWTRLPHFREQIHTMLNRASEVQS